MKGYLRWIFVTAAFGLLMAWSLTEMAAATVVEAGNNIYAYSIEKLRYHETANTMLGASAIVVGY